MAGCSSPRPEPTGATPDWIQEAQAGSTEALGRLLEACRLYLLLIANAELDPELRAKGGASDLVQGTFLEAQRDFRHFRGQTIEDLRGWLRGILRHNLADFTRLYRESGRRQLSQEQSLDDSGAAALHQLAADTPSPVERAAAGEQAQALQAALERLPADYRQVVVLRPLKGRSFPEIGQALERSADAVRKIWLRAIERLREEMQGRHETE